jgi:Cof subfamily protein (haloacid dehalogenase superfamily)
VIVEKGVEKMIYPYLALDLDGTQLNEEKEIDLEVWNSMQAYQARGGHVILASGRTPLATKWIAETLGLSDPIISMNGAFLQEPSGCILGKSIFEYEDLFTFLALCQKQHIYAHFYTESELLVPEINHWNDQWISQSILSLERSGGIPERREYYRQQCAVKLVEDLVGYLQANKPKIYKIAVFKDGEQEDLRLYSEQLKEQIPNLQVSTSLNYKNLEISPKGVSKASTLKVLMAQLGVPLAHVAAVGDNFNDIEMLQSVGLGIAMGNAPAAVQETAGFVTTTNRQAGVARVIQNYLLE